jgi:hypothetical protein
MSSPERKAWRILRSLDVDYVFVLFGGYIGWGTIAAWAPSRILLHLGCCTLSSAAVAAPDNTACFCGVRNSTPFRGRRRETLCKHTSPGHVNRI